MSIDFELFNNDESLKDILQHLPAYHKQEFSRVHTIPYASMTIVKENYIGR